MKLIKIIQTVLLGVILTSWLFLGIIALVWDAIGGLLYFGLTSLFAFAVLNEYITT